MTTSTAIDLLRQVVHHPACTQMNLSTVKGYIGELLVKQLLEAEGYEVEHLGNQSGYDLRFVRQGREVRVDVKMSLPKDEFRWGFSYWGWALQHENKRKGISASHFVCVGCSTDLSIDALFVVAADQVPLFPRGEKQFGKVRHGLVLPSSPLAAAAAVLSSNMYLESQRLYSVGIVRQVSHGVSLASACA